MTSTEQRTRPPAVAGTFYPADTDALAAAVDGYVAAAPHDGPPPKALVVPHAGYVYSGPVAGAGYATLLGLRDSVGRVILLGPAHRVPVRSIATSSADAMRTPLGVVQIDADARERALAFESVVVDDTAHAPEHSIEVHLPFLQRTLARFRVLPLVVGDAAPGAVAEVLDALWGGAETLIVVSTDLSHYLDHARAAEQDRRTATAVTSLDAAGIGTYDACGALPLRGLLEVARRRGLDARLLDLRSSGDTAGRRDRVVGYGAFGFWEVAA